MGFRRRIIRGVGLHLFLGGLVCVALCSCSLFQSQNFTPRPVAKIQTPPPPAPPECGLPYCTVDLDFPLSLITHPTIYVMKEQRRLWLVQDKMLVCDYHVALGPSPRGDKLYRGDGRTPEGEFFDSAPRILPATITSHLPSTTPVRRMLKLAFRQG